MRLSKTTTRSATPSSATAVSATNQTDRSPCSAPMRISASTPIERMSSGMTTGRESAVTSMAFVPDWLSEAGGPQRCGGVLDALQQLFDRSRAGVENRLRMHAVVDGQQQERHEAELLAQAQILDGQQRRLLQDAE